MAARSRMRYRVHLLTALCPLCLGKQSVAVASVASFEGETSNVSRSTIECPIPWTEAHATRRVTLSKCLEKDPTFQIQSVTLRVVSRSRGSLKRALWRGDTRRVLVREDLRAVLPTQVPVIEAVEPRPDSPDAIFVTLHGTHAVLPRVPAALTASTAPVPVPVPAWSFHAGGGIARIKNLLYVPFSLGISRQTSFAASGVSRGVRLGALGGFASSDVGTDVYSADVLASLPVSLGPVVLSPGTLAGLVGTRDRTMTWDVGGVLSLTSAAPLFARLSPAAAVTATRLRRMASLGIEVEL